MRLRCALAVLACLAAVQSADGVVGNTLGVAAPVRGDLGGNVELLGPRSTLVMTIPSAQATANTMTAGQPISIGAMFGVDGGGSIVTPLVDVSNAIVGTPNYDNTNGTTISINLELVPNINDFFLPENLDGFEPDIFDDVVSVRFRVTTADRNLNTDGVQNAFSGVSETSDTCFEIDQTAPRITAAYYEFPFLWIEFSELMSNQQPANNVNQTVLANVDGSDFQTNPSAVFPAVPPSAGAAFTPLSFVSPNTIQIQTGPGLNLNVQPGRFIRCRADEAGLPFAGAIPLHALRDLAGNYAYQQDDNGLPLVTGVVIDAGSPPIFRQWAGEGIDGYLDPSSWAPAGVPGLNDTLLIDGVPDPVVAEAIETVSSSSRLWIGGDVTLSLGFGDTQATFLSYTRTDEPSIVVGYEQLFGSLSLTNDSTVSTSFVTSEWTNVGGPNAGIATLTVDEGTVFRTGKLLVEGPPATLVVNGTAILGFDNGIGGTPPDFGSLVTEGSINVNGPDGFLDANGPVTIGALGTLRSRDGALATLNGGLTTLSGATIDTDSLVIGGVTSDFGIGVLGDVTLAADTAFTGLSVFDAGNARLTINGFEGDGLDLVVDGLVTLGGTLRLEFDPQFNPAAGESFNVISSNFPFSGRFALHILPSFPDDRVATIEYVTPSLGAQAVTLSVQTLPSIIGVDSEGDSAPVPGQPVTAAAGDLNGDGFDDLAVVVPDQNPGQPGSVFIFINNASVTTPGFSSTLQLTVGPDPTDVAIGDFDADSVDIGESDLDLAVTCAGDDSLRVYQNNGSATAFEAVLNIGVPADPSDVDIADFNGDGRDDLVVTCRGADVVRILLNDSSPAATAVGFVQQDDIAAGDEPVDTDPVDLDNDKDIDVVTTNFGAGTVGYASNDSDGNFGAAGFAASGQGANAVDSGDIDGDGDADVVVANLLDGTVTVLANEGGVLSPIGSIPVGSDAVSVVVIDLDSDGDNDIAVVATTEDTQGAQTRQIRILRNDTVIGGPATFAAATNLGAGNGPVYVLSGDVNNDGRNDLISVDSDAGQGAFALSTAGSAPAQGQVTVYLNYTTPSPACAGDANLDGKVNGNDLSAILSKFGQEFPPLTGPNLNGDFVVNGADLSLVLSTYGNVCRE